MPFNSLFARTKHASFVCLSVAVSLAWSGSAHAATSSSSMAVSATVQATCSINASPLPFGTYTSDELDGSTTLAVSCTNTTDYDVGLDAGTGPDATVDVRKMANGRQLLDYTLYSDSGRTAVWGGTSGRDTVSGTGTGSEQTLTVYGRIPSGQLPTPGSYTDTITATITY